MEGAHVWYLHQVQFAAVMETLGNEALGKMMNIVDEVELLESQSRRPQTSFLNVLRNAHIGKHALGCDVMLCKCVNLGVSVTTLLSLDRYRCGTLVWSPSRRFRLLQMLSGELLLTACGAVMPSLTSVHLCRLSGGARGRRR